MTISGYTQPGARPNSLATGTDAVLLIEVKGLDVESGNCGLQGLVVSSNVTVGSGTGSSMRGCYVGTDAAGLTPVNPSAPGGDLYIRDAVQTLIGGTVPAHRNVIAGGIAIGSRNQSSGSVIWGNYLGIAANGRDFTVPLGYAKGIYILLGDDNIIGGDDPAARNVIAGVIQITDSSNNVIQSNFFGTDASGVVSTRVYGGVTIRGNVPPSDPRIPARPSINNKILGNVFAGANDASYVVSLDGEGGIFQGNFVGIGADGKTPVGGGTFTAVLAKAGDRIGGTNPGEGNVIFFNPTDRSGAQRSGIEAQAGCVILGNSIWGNRGVGILGSNSLPAAPVLGAISFNNGTMRVTGTLSAALNSQYRIELFGNDNPRAAIFNQGKYYLGFTNVTTDGNGKASFDVTLPIPPNVTSAAATATGPQGTSPFGASAVSRLVNLSTRANVQTGDNVTIMGFDRLADPTIELRDRNGFLVSSNDDWKSNQAEIAATGIPPRDDRESALIADVLADNYTAILRGKNNTTGVGLIEIYHLQ